MSNQEKDLVLLGDARKGSNKAFTELFNKYRKSIYVLILHILRSHNETEDLMMITFEKAFKDISAYTPTFNFETWLKSIAKNTAFDHLRYTKRRWEKEEIDISMHQNLISPVDNPEDYMIHSQNIEQMENIIEKMRPNRKKIIELRRDGLLCRQIAEELNLTLSAITGQLRYARRELSRICA